MNDYIQKGQDLFSDIIKSRDLSKSDNNTENYSNNSDQNKIYDREEYPVKRTTFSKIKYV